MKEMLYHLNKAFQESKSVTEFTIHYNAFLNSVSSFRNVVYHQVKHLNDYKKLKKEWFDENISYIGILSHARNKIVHDEDIQYSSIYDIKIYYGYKLIDSLNVKGKPVFDFDYLVSLIKTCGLSENTDSSYVRITPRWVSDQYGGIDLIEYAQDAYEHMSKVLKSAHEALDYVGKCSELEYDRFNNQPMDIRTPACFTDYRNRDVWIVIPTGKKYNLSQDFTDFGDFSKEALERYGENKIYKKGVPEVFEEEVRGYVEIAKKIFDKDQYHITLAMLLSEESVQVVELKLENEDIKRIMFIKLADYVRRIKSERVIIIGEGTLKRYEYTDDIKGKEIVYDILMVIGANNKGETYIMINEIDKKYGKRVVGRELKMESMEMPHLYHVLDALTGKD
ncbi:MAG: hypothetical protein V2A56_11145 [bacterium]